MEWIATKYKWRKNFRSIQNTPQNQGLKVSGKRIWAFKGQKHTYGIASACIVFHQPKLGLLDSHV